MPRKGKVLVVAYSHGRVPYWCILRYQEAILKAYSGSAWARRCGVVVAVGEDVLESVKPGDHVYFVYTAECGECEFLPFR